MRPKPTGRIRFITRPPSRPWTSRRCPLPSRTAMPTHISQPIGVVNMRLDVVGLGQGQVGQEAGRQAAEDVAGQATLRGERVHVAAQVLALAQGRRHGEQQLGEVSADLALDPDGHHDPPEVTALHPLGDSFEGVLDGHAQTALDDHPAELAGDRLGALADDGVDGLREGEPGREAAGHQLQGVGQAHAERLQAALLLPPQVEPGPDERRRRRSVRRGRCCSTPGAGPQARRPRGWPRAAAATPPA